MQVYALRHIPTKEFMPTRMNRSQHGGWSHWQPGDPIEGIDYTGFDKNPRIFFTVNSVRAALASWLMGRHCRESGNDGGFSDDGGYDYHDVKEPLAPRNKFDMEIVTLELNEIKSFN